MFHPHCAIYLVDLLAIFLAEKRLSMRQFLGVGGVVWAREMG
jgi:hypothetical protein